MKNKGKIILIAGILCLIAGIVILALCLRSCSSDRTYGGDDAQEPDSTAMTEDPAQEPDDITAPENRGENGSGKPSPGEQATEQAQEEENSAEPQNEENGPETLNNSTETESVSVTEVPQEDSGDASQQNVNETGSGSEGPADPEPEETQTSQGSADGGPDQNSGSVSETSENEDNGTPDNTGPSNIEDVTQPETELPDEQQPQGSSTQETGDGGSTDNTNVNTGPDQDSETPDSRVDSVPGDDGDITLTETDITWTPASPQGSEDADSQENTDVGSAENVGGNSSHAQENEDQGGSGDPGSEGGEVITLPEIEIPGDLGGSGDGSEGGQTQQDSGSDIIVTDTGDIVLPEIP